MIDIKTKKFDQLTTRELYELMRLRVDVFVVEQECPYSELDGLDTDSNVAHILVYDEQELVAYARCLPPGLAYEKSAAIGRVIVKSSHRGKGLANELMIAAIDTCNKTWGSTGIEISAQYYLVNFYKLLGFEAEGEEYLEDGIPHIHMVFQKRD